MWIARCASLRKKKEEGGVADPGVEPPFLPTDPETATSEGHISREIIT